MDFPVSLGVKMKWPLNMENSSSHSNSKERQDSEGAADGRLVGESNVGFMDGVLVGTDNVGASLGLPEGKDEGNSVVGISVGICESEHVIEH